LTSELEQYIEGEMEDTRGAFMSMALKELHIHMLAIAGRRGLTPEEVELEALQRFVEEDWLNPKGPHTDAALALPSGEEGIFYPDGSDVPVDARQQRMELPNIDSCPDHALDEWLNAVRSDIDSLWSLRTRDVGVPQRHGPEYVSRITRILEEYRRLEARLELRIEAAEKS